MERINYEYPLSLLFQYLENSPLDIQQLVYQYLIGSQVPIREGIPSFMERTFPLPNLAQRRASKALTDRLPTIENMTPILWDTTTNILPISCQELDLDGHEPFYYQQTKPTVLQSGPSTSRSYPLGFYPCDDYESAIQSQERLCRIVWHGACVGISFPIFYRGEMSGYQQYQLFKSLKGYFTVGDLITIILDWYRKPFSRGEVYNILRILGANYDQLEESNMSFEGFTRRFHNRLYLYRKLVDGILLRCEGVDKLIIGYLSEKYDKKGQPFLDLTDGTYWKEWIID